MTAETLNTQGTFDQDALAYALFSLAMALLGSIYYFVSACQGRIRSKVFSKEFMSQFDQQHQEAFGTPATVGGYPDTGNGYYADKLSYKDWYVFNNWQRA